MNALLFDIKHYAVHDGPGIRTTFFLKGCPLRCLWCQNPESISPRQEVMLTSMKCIGCGSCKSVCTKLNASLMLPQSACTQCGDCIRVCKTGARHFAAKSMTPQEVLKIALSDKVFYQESGGGVTFSGGECLTHSSFMEETLRLCKENGLHTTVDTCGAVPWSTFEQVLPYTDLFLYDLKLLDPLRHKQYTGMDNHLILHNIQKLVSSHASLIIRIPLIPSHTDLPEDLEATADFIVRKLNRRILRVELLQYNRLAASKYGNSTVYTDGGVGDYPLPSLEPQSRETMEGLREIFVKKEIPVFAEML